MGFGRHASEARLLACLPPNRFACFNKIARLLQSGEGQLSPRIRHLFGPPRAEA
jgi:hypothetical protein